MTTLQEVIERGKLYQFIAEHECEAGDADAFDATLRSMAEMSKEAPEETPHAQSGD